MLTLQLITKSFGWEPKVSEEHAGYFVFCFTYWMLVLHISSWHRQMFPNFPRHTCKRHLNTATLMAVFSSSKHHPCFFFRKERNSRKNTFHPSIMFLFQVRASLPAGKQVVAFQNRNPVHKAHFELLVPCPARTGSWRLIWKKTWKVLITYHPARAVECYNGAAVLVCCFVLDEWRACLFCLGHPERFR